MNSLKIGCHARFASGDGELEPGLGASPMYPYEA